MIKPLGHKVILEQIHEKERTAAGLYIPNYKDHKFQEAVVIAVGPDVPESVEPDCRVVYDKYAGAKVEYADKEYLIILDDDILGVILPDDAQTPTPADAEET